MKGKVTFYENIPAEEITITNAYAFRDRREIFFHTSDAEYAYVEEGIIGIYPYVLRQGVFYKKDSTSNYVPYYAIKQIFVEGNPFEGEKV